MKRAGSKTSKAESKTTERVKAIASQVRACWSPETATTYTASNPAKGQCSVTALLVQAELGGELVKTWIGDAWHF